MSKLHCTISKIKDGNMSFKYTPRREVESNRKIFFQKNNIKQSETIFMNIEMGEDILIVSEKDRGNQAMPADALITTDKNLPLFLLIADCLPIALHDPQKEVLALVHSGWPNTDLQLTKRVVQKMKNEFQCNIEDLVIKIGPGISKDSLIYDNNIFNLTHSNWGEYIQEREKGKYHIDNLGYTLKQLQDIGIKEEQIDIDNTDTFSSDEYFSHVKDHRLGQKDQGRFCMIVYITD